MKLSIIIPAYNVERYIGNCLKSIFDQHIEPERLEVIVVNDGSEDRTEDIVKNHAERHSNLIYIYQENHGQGVARNTGLKKATGDLVWYVDSDDATTENSISTIFSYFEKYPDADFLTFDRIHYNFEDGTKRYCKSWGGRKAPQNTYEKRLDGVIANKYLVASVPWLHVFRRDYIVKNNLFFAPELLNEDDELRMRLFFFAKEVRYIPFAHYVYSAMRPGSLTTENHTFTMKSAKSCIGIIESWKKFKSGNANTKKQKRYIYSFITSKYQSLMLLATRKEDEDLYELYQENKDEWRKGFRDSFKKSIGLVFFSWIELIRYIVTLYCPQYIEYTKLSKLKNLLKGSK